VSRHFGGIFEIEKKRERAEDLDRQATLPEFWTDQAAAQKVLKEKGGLERTVHDWEALRRRCEDLGALLDLANEFGDEDSANEARAGITALEEALRLHHQAASILILDRINHAPVGDRKGIFLGRAVGQGGKGCGGKAGPIAGGGGQPRPCAVNGLLRCREGCRESCLVASFHSFRQCLKL
jgi:protein subunit release factor A